MCLCHSTVWCPKAWGHLWEDRKGVCGPGEMCVARTMAWCRHSRAREGLVRSVASWLSTVQKMSVHGKLRNSTGRGNDWEMGMWPAAGWLGGCAFCPTLREAVAGGTQHPQRASQQLHPQRAISKCNRDRNCPMCKRCHLVAKDRRKCFL